MDNLSEHKVTKKQFKQMVFNVCNRIASKYHVFNVVNILIDEMRKDLHYKNSSIKIKNFCEISLIKNKPRKYWSVKEQKIMTSSGNYQTIFKLPKALKKIIYTNIDIDSL